MKYKTDSSTANSLTDRLGVGQRMKHIDTRYIWIQERVQDGDLRYEASLCFSTTRTLQICRSGILLTMDPTLHYKMKGDEADDGSGEGLQPRYEHRELT